MLLYLHSPAQLHSDSYIVTNGVIGHMANIWSFAMLIIWNVILLKLRSDNRKSMLTHTNFALFMLVLNTVVKYHIHKNAMDWRMNRPMDNPKKHQTSTAKTSMKT